MHRLFAPIFWTPLLFGGCGLTIWLLPEGDVTRLPLIMGLFLIIAFFVSVATHEVGHLIGAVLARFQVINFVVGPVLIAAKVGGGYKVLPNLNPKLWEGHVISLPRGFDKLRKRFMVVIGGGPLASLIFGLVFVVLSSNAWQSWRTTIPEGISPSNFNLWSWGCFLGFLGWVSVVIFIINIIPFRTDVFPSDGLQLLRLGRGGLKAKRTTALLVSHSLFMLRERPRNLPVEIVSDILSLRENTADEAEALLVAYLFALDAGELEKADEHLMALKLVGHKASSLSQPIMALWIAFHEAMYRQNFIEARKWLNEANSRSLNDATLLYNMVNASVLFLEGNNQQAVQYAEKWAALFTQEAKLGGEIIFFFKEQMEKITKRYIAVIKPILQEMRK